MSWNKSAKKLERKLPMPRETVDPVLYSKAIKGLRDYWTGHNVVLVKLEARYYADTGGTLWTATIEVGCQHPKLKPAGIALIYAGLCFPGIYMPRLWELRALSNPTYELSWWTNDPE